MTAITNLLPAIKRSTVFGTIALASLVPGLFPHQVFAQEQVVGIQAQVFEIKDSQNLSTTNTTVVGPVVDENYLTIDEVQAADPLTTKLEAYFKKYNSPYADYAAEIHKVPLWQKSIAISWVESNYCVKAMNRNCSSIGVAPGHRLWRKYDTELDWLKDMSRLMQKPIYSEKYTTFEKMRGVYVVPGSSAWVNGATQKYNELMALTEEAEAERVALANINSDNENLHTFALAK